ncbi:unnamed protein product [Arctogadus glacialis]
MSGLHTYLYPGCCLPTHRALGTLEGSAGLSHRQPLRREPWRLSGLLDSLRLEAGPSETLTLTAAHISATAPQLAEEKEAADRSRGSEVVPGHGTGPAGSRRRARGDQRGVLVTPSRALITGAR